MMTEQEFMRIALFLKRKYGIDMERKRAIVEGRLENYVKSEGWMTYSQYMDAVEKDISGALEKKLVDLLSTNHTYFMRESEHFDFGVQLLPPERNPIQLLWFLWIFLVLNIIDGIRRCLRQMFQQKFLNRR